MVVFRISEDNKGLVDFASFSGALVDDSKLDSKLLMTIKRQRRSVFLPGSQTKTIKKLYIKPAWNKTWFVSIYLCDVVFPSAPPAKLKVASLTEIWVAADLETWEPAKQEETNNTNTNPLYILFYKNV